jgi:hypothetical protein
MIRTLSGMVHIIHNDASHILISKQIDLPLCYDNVEI